MQHVLQKDLLRYVEVIQHVHACVCVVVSLFSVWTFIDS